MHMGKTHHKTSQHFQRNDTSSFFGKCVSAALLPQHDRKRRFSRVREKAIDELNTITRQDLDVRRRLRVEARISLFQPQVAVIAATVTDFGRQPKALVLAGSRNTCAWYRNQLHTDRRPVGSMRREAVQ
jgi:hypothetical protein